MHIVQKPMKQKIEKHICEFHRKHPGANFPGCTCWTSFLCQEKEFSEMTVTEIEQYFAALQGERPDGSPLY